MARLESWEAARRAANAAGRHVGAAVDVGRSRGRLATMARAEPRWCVGRDWNPRTFPPEGLKVLWRVPVGIGFSSPIVAGGRVYVTDSVLAKPEARERVHAFDATTGEHRWTLRVRSQLPRQGVSGKVSTGTDCHAHSRRRAHLRPGRRRNWPAWSQPRAICSGRTIWPRRIPRAKFTPRRLR